MVIESLQASLVSIKWNPIWEAKRRKKLLSGLGSVEMLSATWCRGPFAWWNLFLLFMDIFSVLATAPNGSVHFGVIQRNNCTQIYGHSADRTISSLSYSHGAPARVHYRRMPIVEEKLNRVVNRPIVRRSEWERELACYLPMRRWLSNSVECAHNPASWQWWPTNCAWKDVRNQFD